ncbi:MAG: ABC transporter ATP-binding protein [Candidatus Riflebacteria bacterium]|nr:ABC transporter ATP-binding protein [Candidatus Riflebacteria bacterium]
MDSAIPLKVENLKKAYRGRDEQLFWAVKGISFEIKQNECFGLLGPNGAGKSTSMHCITGFYPTSGGSVKILDYDPHTQPKLARQYLGVCPQDDTLDSDFTVFDQMVRYASYFKIPTSEAENRAQKLLEEFKIADKSKNWIEELSGGMRRRLQVARALISNPRLLVLDEPTTGLDPEVRRFLWSLIEQFRRDGGAVLISTHYIEEAERLCDRVAIMYMGEILDCESPKNLIQKHIANEMVEEEIRPGLKWKRPPNLEDVYLKITGEALSKDNAESERELSSPLS